MRRHTPPLRADVLCCKLGESDDDVSANLTRLDKVIELGSKHSLNELDTIRDNNPISVGSACVPSICHFLDRKQLDCRLDVLDFGGVNSVVRFSYDASREFRLHNKRKEKWRGDQVVVCLVIRVNSAWDRVSVYLVHLAPLRYS